MRQIRLRRDLRIPLRDGISLSATLYVPTEPDERTPAIFTLTPYVGQTYHEQGTYFARRGYAFLTVDARGRGDSEGTFKPYLPEARDGADVVTWLAAQPFCNGKVAMWGGSYAGYGQWMTASECPAQLATVVPVASPFFGVDFPIHGNIASPYWIQWLSLVSGRTSQDRVFGDAQFWRETFKRWFESGSAFKSLDALVWNPSPVFQEWVAHPECDEYWDQYNPTDHQYRMIAIPILTITGIYDGDQLGALAHYRQHTRNAAPGARSKHYLIIGPWDHAGTRAPKLEFAGITVGPASMLDLQQLHLQWYDWAMKEGKTPGFLERNVAYYVMGAEQWRYADSLEDITTSLQMLFLQSSTNPADVLRSGSLTTEPPSQVSPPDHYVYDPSDMSRAEIEGRLDQQSWISAHHMSYPANGSFLFYHSDPLQRDTEFAGFFRLSVWLSIDAPDTDFSAAIYDVRADGSVILLTTDCVRARYRQSLRESTLIETIEPLKYEFERFSFVACVLKRGSRLRVVIGPINSIYTQKNFNSGKVVAEESMTDARTVTVKLFHDQCHPSVLHVPYGRNSVAGRYAE